jgi:hypothetical protein
MSTDNETLKNGWYTLWLNINNLLSDRPDTNEVLHKVHVRSADDDRQKRMLKKSRCIKNFFFWVFFTGTDEKGKYSVQCAKKRLLPTFMFDFINNDFLTFSMFIFLK